MKYVKFEGGTGYCGCDFEEYGMYLDNITDSELDAILSDMVYENALSYEHVVTGWGEDFESEEERESYYEDTDGSWEFVSKEEYYENV